jgi:hypothetical protein
MHGGETDRASVIEMTRSSSDMRGIEGDSKASESMAVEKTPWLIARSLARFGGDEIVRPKLTGQFRFAASVGRHRSRIADVVAHTGLRDRGSITHLDGNRQNWPSRPKVWQDGRERLVIGLTTRRQHRPTWRSGLSLNRKSPTSCEWDLTSLL